MTTKGPTAGRSRLRTPLVIVGAVVVVAVVWSAGSAARSMSPASSADQIPVFPAKQGPLTISVAQSGTIQALEQVIIKSEVEGQVTIIYLVPEGTLVKEGDLLIELDASKLQDDLVDQQIRAQNTEAAFIRARENLAVTKNQTQSDISKAELDYRFAQEDLTQYVEGEKPKQVKELDSKITLAKEEWERASEKLEWSRKLFEAKFISQTELEADRLTFNREKLDHELAVASLDLLNNYTSKRQLDQLKSDIEQAAMALERVKLKANADIVQAEAELRASEAEFNQQKSKLEKFERQITKCKIRAPRKGLVVYATSAKTSWRGNREPLDEGQGVRERQELIYLPTADAMKAEVDLHESNLEKVKLGLPAIVKVDAVPGKTYVGRVAKIAPLPDANSMFMNPDLKIYKTEIHLEGNNSELRTGMSCKTEIIIEQYDNAIYVPVHAVVRIGDQPTVYVRSGNRFERHSVEIGLDNNRMARIVSGLEPGQEVSLAPPLEAASAMTEEKLAVDTEMQGRLESMAPIETPVARELPARAPGPPGDRGSGARGVEAGEDRPREERGMMEGREGMGGMPDMSSEGMERMRRRFENMTPEQREEMRKRFENMTPEQLEQMRQRRQNRQPGERGGEGPGGERRRPRGDGGPGQERPGQEP
ncbi:MAG: efflux RND transporter periplasmic adaptor subunit [Acidobacteriota bacterium]